MLSIRLRRTGKKHQASFRVIVVDKRKDPWGNYLEALGSYNPRTKASTFNVERIKYWLGKGAEATPTVWNLLVDQKAVEGKKKKATTGTLKKKEVAPVVVAPTPAKA